MSLLHNDVYDNGLNEVSGANRILHVLTQEPATLGDIATYTIGNKPDPTISSPVDRIGGGRRVTISAFSDGDVTDTDIATAWAIEDNSSGTERLLAVGLLSSGQSLNEGNLFTMTEFSIGIPAPA